MACSTGQTILCCVVCVCCKRCGMLNRPDTDVVVKLVGEGEHGWIGDELDGGEYVTLYM